MATLPSGHLFDNGMEVEITHSGLDQVRRLAGQVAEALDSAESLIVLRHQGIWQDPA